MQRWFPRLGRTGDPRWMRCDRCRAMVYVRQWEDNLRVCPSCGHHARLRAAERVALLLDPGSFEELDADLRPGDPLGFAPPGLTPYARKLEDERARSGMVEAAVYGRGLIAGSPVVFCAFDVAFFTGSLASVPGEKVARAAEAAIRERAPLVVCAAGSGARQQEGVVALLQMAKTAAAVRAAGRRSVPFVSILTDYTLGGTTASFASLGDVVLAEPGAEIGFLGRRLLEAATREKLPADAQTAEFQLAHGMIDRIVPRRELRATLTTVLRSFGAPASA